MVNINGLGPGQKVLLISNANVSPEEVHKIASEIEKIVTSDGEVKVENLERLKSGDVQDRSCYDVILSGVLSPYSITHSVEALAHYLALVKPRGRIVVQEIVKTGESDLRTEEELVSSLKISGLVDISQRETVELEEDDRKMISAFLEHDEFKLVKFETKKPNFEMGTSSKIKLGGRGVPESVASVWKLDNGVEDDIIDSELLLDEDDLKKPDPASLKVCGTTGKRKACKNCSCGLAEELATADGGDAPLRPDNPKSSCGNCYLGDAFRCAGCPYLGRPAFKPGDKISLSDAQMTPDL